MTTQRALIILHPQFEEIEAVVPIDLLSRADIQITSATTTENLLVTGRSGITMKANVTLGSILDEVFDLIILPGGPGISSIRKEPRICNLFQKHHASEKPIGCICAAPLLLLDAELLNNITVSAHPSTHRSFERTSMNSVCNEKKLITSSGAGTATEFALELVRELTDSAKATEIAASICWPHSF